MSKAGLRSAVSKGKALKPGQRGRLACAAGLALLLAAGQAAATVARFYTGTAADMAAITCDSDHLNWWFLVTNDSAPQACSGTGTDASVCRCDGASWVDAFAGVSGGGGGGGSSTLLNSTAHTDTLTGTVVRGDIIRGNSTPKWSRLAIGAANRVLSSDGTDAAWSTVPDAALANNYSGVGACAANTFASTLNDNASPTCTQPAFSDLSGAATDAQIPNSITIDNATTAANFSGNYVASVATTAPLTGGAAGSNAAALTLAISNATTAAPGAVQLETNSADTTGGALHVVTSSDTRLSDSRAPNGSAGGDLTGTYPNPTVAANSIALGTDTTGNYAGSSSEGGPATTASALASGADVPLATVTVTGNGTASRCARFDASHHLVEDSTDCGGGGGGSGTVTSVDMTVPSILSVSGSPITTSGTLALSLSNQNANCILAGPASGSAAAPTCRAAVTEDDAFEPLRAYRWQDEMIGTADTASSVLTWAVTSGTTSTTTDGEAGHPGIITMSTSSSATGNVRVISSGNAILFGGGAWTYYAVFRLPTLSDGTNTYTVRLGFLDSGTAESTDGFFVRYTNGTNSGKFQCVSRNNGSENAVDSTVTAVGGTWYALTLTMNAGGTSGTCKLNGTTSTTSSQIPTGAGRTTGFGAMILKSLGGTARTMDLDAIAVQWIATTSR